MWGKPGTIMGLCSLEWFAMVNSPKYCRADDVVATEMDGNILLLSTRSWSYLEFDKTGTAIWTLLDTPRTLPSLVEALTVKFEVDEATCAADTRSFLDEMIAEGVVKTM